MNYHKDSINKRLIVNRLLLGNLAQLIEDNPSQRFGQILLNYFFSNYNSLEGMDLHNTMYNEEPAKTYANLCSK